MRDYSSLSTKGLNAKLARWILDFHLQSSAHSHFAAHLLPPTSRTDATVIHGVSAAAAGAIATLATHPFDVIKVSGVFLILSTYNSYHSISRRRCKCAQKNATTVS